MIKKIAFTTFLVFLMLACTRIQSASEVYSPPQMMHPAHWKFRLEEKKNGEAEIIFKLKLDEGWHTYSQHTPDGGPLPMVFTFDTSSCYSTIGGVTEPKPIQEYDSIFGVMTLIFHHEVEFRQKIKIRENGCTIRGSINYQACLESCINQDTTFVLHAGKSTGEKTINPPDTSTAFAVPISTSIDSPEIAVVAPVKPPVDKDSELESSCGDGAQISPNRSFLGIFIAGLLGGLVALLTPCVFPMIPLTVSFFTKRSGSRKKGIKNAFLYAFSIVFIYVSLGLLVTVTLGSAALNDLASNAFFNLAFFFIFFIFAISFFGAFEITLPSWLINKADSASDRGGILGIFFMAFTLSLVSFSCTGPIIGTLLVEAAAGQSLLGPFAGMLGFSLALAIPFAFFSLFPNWLNSLPKSGTWLNTVKVTLGFVELALAMKFLSNVDMAYHWNFLKRELFICIWIVITLMLGFYLLGKIRLSSDSEVKHLSTGRLVIALFVFVFALYLVPGIWGAPLKLISGFPPPEFYKEWGPQKECPHDLNCFHDYEEGIAYARAQEKPIMIDFTGWSCVNCRKMEEQVWVDPTILKRLMFDYVVISLYVDDKKSLPEEQQYVTADGKKIKTVGGKWSDFQATKYKSNSQPHYVLIDTKEKILAKPQGGMMSKENFLAYLEEGLCRFRLRN